MQILETESCPFLLFFFNIVIISKNVHVILNELLDLCACEFVLSEFHIAVFKFVAEMRWSEQNNAPATCIKKTEY